MIKILDDSDEPPEGKIEEKAYNEGFVHGYESGTKFAIGLIEELASGSPDKPPQLLSNWVNLEGEPPEEERLLLYYFSMTGIGVGYYYGRELEYPSENDHVFGGNAGFLTGDVTHWMYAPEEPTLPF